jgi:outer membrane autotransporter protein
MTSGGGATGIDLQLDRNFLLGFAMGTASAAYSLGDLNSSGLWRATTFGIYGGYSDGPAYLDAALGLGYGSFSTTRFIATGTMSERIDGATDAWQFGGRAEAGWRFALDRHSFTPFAGLTVQSCARTATPSPRGIWEPARPAYWDSRSRRRPRPRCARC